MTKQKEKFINGCVKNDMAQGKAEELFSLIEPFAAYGFNKAHAASYAIIAYQTAYMKANFPVEFMTAVMSAESDDPDKISLAVSECAKMKILVLPPDVNFSQTGFTIEKTKKGRGVRFGLSAIKNVGKAAIDAIITERDDGGEFESIDNFVKRVNLRVVNRKTLESLIKAGAMDRFGKRNAMLKVLDELKSTGQSLSKSVAEGQGSLFTEGELEKASTSSTIVSTVMASVAEAPREEILSWERELLGFYLSENPLSKLSGKLAKVTTTTIGNLGFERGDREVRLGGIIAGIRKTLTKVRKEEMCFAKLQDQTGTIEVICFPKVYATAKNYLLPDQIVVIAGKVEANEQNPVLIADSVAKLEDATKTSDDQIIQEMREISLPPDTDRVLLSEIYGALKSYPGNIPITLIIPTTSGNPKKFPVPFSSSFPPDLITRLESLGCKIIN